MRKVNLLLATLLIFLGVHASLLAKDEAVSAPGGNLFECQIDPSPESNFMLACFRLWLPSSRDKIRGILFVLPGSDAHGTPIADDPGWQSVARKWNYGLIGATFTTRRGFPPYALAEKGSGAALLSALNQFAIASSRPELTTLPIAILGHSQGGQFAFQFACWQPAHVAAFAAIKGGYYDPKINNFVRQVPGLLLAGELDSDYRRTNIRKLFDLNPSPNGRWCFASEPGIGHDPGRCPDLIVPFFEAIVNKDLQPTLGNLETLSLEPLHPQGNTSGVWLPTREVAQIWQSFSQGTLSKEASLKLTIPLAPPPKLGSVSPATHDFGKLKSGTPPPITKFRILKASTDDKWDSVQIVPLSSRCEITEIKDGDAFTFAVRPKLEGLPLGRLKETVAFRFLKNGQPLMGIADATMSLQHTHEDVTFSPHQIYFGTHDELRMYKVKLTANNGKRLNVTSAKLLTGEAAEIRTENVLESSADLVCTFLPLQEEGEHSGTFLITITEPISAEIILPFMGFYKCATK